MENKSRSRPEIWLLTSKMRRLHMALPTQYITHSKKPVKLYHIGDPIIYKRPCEFFFIFEKSGSGHVGRQMTHSSHRFSFSNILFYFLCFSATSLIAAATGLPTFGDSSSFCTVVILGKFLAF